MLSGDSKFILQSLTTSKMRKSQTKKLSQFHKAKTFKGSFYVLGGIFFFLNFENIVESALKKLHKSKFKKNLFAFF